MLQAFGTVVQDYYVRKVRANDAARKARLDAISTPEQFKVYQQEIREKIKKAFMLPAEKTPLNAKITGTLTRPGFRVEKVIYDSRPLLTVTADLYIPDGAQNAPAVLFLSGHSCDGKASDTYQRMILSLVANGYVVLAPDPSGQGERSQLADVPGAYEFYRSPTMEHNMINKQMILTGEFYMSWCLWDAVRSFDYLASRPEVNPATISVTGNSGGGNMSAFMTAIEERLYAAAPSCYITTWLHNLENEEPACAEQEPQFLLGMGCEMGDLLLAYAPRPLLILGQKNDFFDARGTAETYEEVRRFYKMLGAEDKVRLFIGPRSHGYHLENRAAAYKFFNELYGKPAPAPEPEEMELFTEEELQCTPQGQVSRMDWKRITIDLIREIADSQKLNRPALSKQELQVKCREMLNFDEKTVTVPHYRNLKYRASGSRYFTRYALETEENMLAILKRMRSDWVDYNLHYDYEKVQLYIPHVDAQDEMLRLPMLEDAVQFGLDYRGVGELMPLGCNLQGGHAQEECLKPYRTEKLYSYYDTNHREFFSSYCCDYNYSAFGLMLGEPYLGGRVRDIVSAVKLMKEHRFGTIDMIAEGQGCIPALFAKLLCDDIATLTLHNAPESFDAQLRTKITYLPQSIMPTGILKFTDIPELVKAAGAILQ